MSTEDEKLMKGKKSDIKLNKARKPESMSYISLLADAVYLSFHKQRPCLTFAIDFLFTP